MVIEKPKCDIQSTYRRTYFSFAGRPSPCANCCNTGTYPCSRYSSACWPARLTGRVPNPASGCSVAARGPLARPPGSVIWSSIRSTRISPRLSVRGIRPVRMIPASGSLRPREPSPSPPGSTTAGRCHQARNLAVPLAGLHPPPPVAPLPPVLPPPRSRSLCPVRRAVPVCLEEGLP